MPEIPLRRASAEAWAGYASALVEIDAGGGRVLRFEPGSAAGGHYPFDGSVYVVSAANPQSRRLPAAENAARGDALRTRLIHCGVSWRYAVGYSADRSWLELSYALSDTDVATAIGIGAEFEQASIFALSPGRLEVVSIDGSIAAREPRTLRVVDWAQSIVRQAAAELGEARG
jgi:hypothetical protein